MDKKIWMVLGVVLIVGAIWLSQRTPDKVEHVAVEENVPKASRLPRSDEGRRGVGDTNKVSGISDKNPEAVVEDSLSVEQSGQKPKMTLNSIPDSIRPLFEAGYIERCRFAKGLGANLSQDEIDALFLFITSSPEQVGLDRGNFRKGACVGICEYCD